VSAKEDAMNVSKPVRMTADEFLAWGLRQDSGRYELDKGELVTMAPERAKHVRTKTRLCRMFEEGISKARLTAEALADGMSVPIDERTVYEPDALVRLGSLLGGDEVKVVDPVIVAEVLSPSTESVTWRQSSVATSACLRSCTT
jgi:Uma2 family endonuclease